jgi:putative ABC transport system substrate-binding protein
MWYSAVGSIVTLMLSLLAVPLATHAQPAGKVWRIGYLGLAGSEEIPEAFRQGLRELGYVEGQNIVIEYRSADGKFERLPDLAAELVRLPVDVMVTPGNPETLAAKAATSTIPIVFAGAVDPVDGGLIASWAQPGENITGAAGAGMEGGLMKQLELLKEVVPAATRVAVLLPLDTPLYGVAVQHAQAAAQRLRLDLYLMAIRDPATELERAFAALARERVDAFFGLVSAFTRHRTQIVELVAASRLPAIYNNRLFVETGGLMSYTPDREALRRRAAIMVGKILGGAKPADIPAEYPTKFHLALNLKTAKALGMTILPHLLVLADEVIQ